MQRLTEGINKKLCGVRRVLCIASLIVPTHLFAAEQNDSLPKVQALPKKGVAYEVDIAQTDDTTISDNMAAASQLVSLQKTRHVGPYALAGRIRGDYARLQGALQSRGYYAGRVVVRVSLHGKTLEGTAPDLASFLNEAGADDKVQVRIQAEPGIQFTIGQIVITPLAATPAEGLAKDKEPSLSEAERKSMGVQEGQPAIAGDILAAQGRLSHFLQEEGYGLADVQTPQAMLRPNHQIDVYIKMKRGPKLIVGPIALEGLKRVKERYVRRRLALKEGQLYQPSAIEQARLDLGSTGLFSSIQQRNADYVLPLPPQGASAKGKVDKKGKAPPLPAGAEGALPLSFDFDEGKRHRITGDVGYSTDLGGRAGVSWLHRNFLGNGEQLRVAALATGLGGTAQQGVGYDAYVDFTKPDFLKRSQTLNVRLEGIRQLLYSYGQTAFLLHGGVSRPLGKDLSGSIGATVEQEHIRQFGHKAEYFIASLPLQLDYDGTHRSNPIEPATHGVKASIGVTPSLSLEHQTSFFIPMNAQASTYFDLTHLGLTKPGNSVIALRAMVGSVQGATTWHLPPDQRLYAGGPGSVRGYRYQGVGPQYQHTKYAIGGTAMDAGTVEFRQRLPKNLGVVGFVDAGQVSSGSIPAHGKLRVGYGGGVRYFTPIGPVRVDVAFPLHRAERGDRWELYLGLGETF